MSAEKLFRAIGEVGDDLIARADGPVKKKKPVRWVGLAALAACCVLAIGFARLVTQGYGSSSTDSAAPETAYLQAADQEASGAADTNSMLKQERAEETVDAAEAKEAPAEEAPADSAPSATTTETAEDGGEAWTLGPLTLGMRGEEIQAVLGAPDGESNSGPVEYEDGSLRVCWFYRIDTAPEWLHSVKLDLVDIGEGWQLDAVTLWPDVDWTTPEGIGIGSTEADVISAYSGETMAIADGTASLADGTEAPETHYTIGEGQTTLKITVTNGVVSCMTLGTYFAEPPFEAE